MSLSRCGIVMLLVALLLLGTSCNQGNPPPAESPPVRPILTDQGLDADGVQVFESVGHAASIQSYAFSTDMKYLAVAGNPGDVQLLEVGSGAEAQLDRHDDLTYVVAFAPNSSVFAVCGHLNVIGGDGVRNCDLALIDAATRKETQTFRTSDIVEHLTFSPDGSLLATGGGMTASVYNVASGEVEWTQSFVDEILLPTCLAFSPDGQRLAVGLNGSSPQIRIWTLDDDAEPVSYAAHATDEAQTVMDLAFSSDGSQIISVGLDGFIRISDSATGEQSDEIKPSEHTNYDIYALSLSDDGETIAVARNGWDDMPLNGLVELYDLASGELKKTFHATDGYRVSFTPDGKSVAAGYLTLIRLMPL